jgi:hypothetical protein
MDQAFSVHYFLELAQLVADLASQGAQGPGLTAMDGPGGCNSRLTLRGPWASAQAAVATALGRSWDGGVVAACAPAFDERDTAELVAIVHYQTSGWRYLPKLLTYVSR